MDNYAYLQQISGATNKKPTSTGKGLGSFDITKFLNWKIFAILGLVIALIIGVSVVASSMNQVDTRDRDLLIQSYYRATYLTKETLNDYITKLKSSDLRDMSASLRTILTEMINDYDKVLLDNYGVNVEKLKKGSIATSELNINNKLQSTLEYARMNAKLDRTYNSEITMQIAYLVSFQSECNVRTEYNAVKTVTEKYKTNLKTIYDQFSAYSI